MEHLLPENGFDVAKFLVGTEGTLATIVSAQVKLVADLPHKAMIALGYPTMPDAGDDAALLLPPHHPTAAEGLDRRIVNVVAHKHGLDSIPKLPNGGDGWIFVELADTDPDRLAERTAA